MVGTLVNAAAVTAGACVGLAAKKGIPEHVSDACMKALGAAVAVIGMSGALRAMFTADPSGALSSDGGMVLLVSMALGTLVGEVLKLHDLLERAGNALEKKFKSGGFSEGFLTASVLFCSGAMTIVGAFQDASGDPSLLFVKSALDGISAVFLASALGAGVAFAAVFVLVYQGLLTLFAGVLTGMMTPVMQNAVDIAGYTIVFCLALNMLGAARLRVANMIPSLAAAALLAAVDWGSLAARFAALFG